jgi:hypothetical protein
MKKCSASQIITEMLIKTTMRYHFTSVKMAVTKTTKDKNFQECGETAALAYYWGEMENGAATMGNCVEIPQRIKCRTIM